MKVDMGSAFKDPRNEVYNDRGKGGVFVSQNSAAQQGIPQNPFTIPYLLFAYDVKRTTFQRRLKGDKLGMTALPSLGLTR